MTALRNACIFASPACGPACGSCCACAWSDPDQRVPARQDCARKIGIIVVAAVGADLPGLRAFSSASRCSVSCVRRSPEASRSATPRLLDSFPALLVSGATGGILLTSFGVLLQALYLSGDMDFLMSAPIPIRVRSSSPSWSRPCCPTSCIMCLFTLPVLFGLGISGGYNFLYYPLVLVLPDRADPGRGRAGQPAGDGGGAFLPGPPGGGSAGFCRRHLLLRLFADRRAL